MTRSSLALVVALLASACAAPRSTSPSSGSVAKADNSVAKADVAKTDEDKKRDSSLICYQEAPTGSHIVKTVCYTPEQLSEMGREAQDFVRQTTRTGARAGMPNSPGGSSGGGR